MGNITLSPVCKPANTYCKYQVSLTGESKPHGRQSLYVGSGSMMLPTRFCIIAVDNFKNAHCLNTRT